MTTSSLRSRTPWSRSLLPLGGILALLSPIGAAGQDAPELSSSLLTGLEWRGIGPAMTSGRVADIAVHPTDRHVWFVAAASGGVWKTENAGTTWTPVFDDAGSYSIGAVTIDPANPLTVWVGTGENKGQRSVGYGDGVYRSRDGGTTFENVGLEASEHIGMIVVHPDDSDVVYVAAQGPLWASGGDRGLFRTVDGGTTWEPILEVDEHTGISEVHLDPRDPDVMYAVAWQRRRHQWTMIDGGPSSGVWKSTDAGETWREINRGLPGGDKGRMGLEVSPIDPDVLYLIVEASGRDGGTFRSETMGESWTRTSRYQSGAAMYYHEIVADPHRFDRIYSLDTFLEVSNDGGRTWERAPGQYKHVDHHALWFDPDVPGHMITGNDGGVYESWDHGENWSYFDNLPITQFYKVAVSNDEPFYFVYGGTQDNNTLGGPSRTTTSHGIRNSDWFVTLGGDGFDPVVDPENPDIVYSQLQYGVLSRFDRRTGERLDIQPQESADGPPLRWNWDSGIELSPHDPQRLYFGAQILFRSDDQGSTWQPISGDLTRDLDRNALPVMGRVWSVDAVGKNRSTSPFGSIVTVSESPLVEGLLYVGTDDGLIQVSEDGGGTWRRVESLPGVPDTSYISDLEASLHDPDVVYAVAQNFKRGDFRPFVLRSEDRGQTWTSLAGTLPDNGPTYALAQDHEVADVLFVGAERGVWASVDGGAEWMQLSAGMPTVAVRDLEIQRREQDVVAASFGRGFFILDDYTPLRELARERAIILAAAGHVFPVRDADMFLVRGVMGGGEKASQGAGLFTAPNPEFGATFTYWLGTTLRTAEAERQRAEREAQGDGRDTPYPSWDALRAEDREIEPRVVLTVRDETGSVVRHVAGSTSRGVHRATWDFRYPAFTPVTGSGGGGGFGGPIGPLALPGTYTVELSERIDGETRVLAGPITFQAVPLGEPSIPAQERATVLAFQRETGALQRAVLGTVRAVQDADERLTAVSAALDVTPAADARLHARVRDLRLRLADIRDVLNGDRTRTARAEPDMPGVVARVNQVVFGHWNALHGPTETHREQYRLASARFADVYADAQQLLEQDLPALESALEDAGAPWTPGRPLPRWSPSGGA